MPPRTNLGAGEVTDPPTKTRTRAMAAGDDRAAAPAAGAVPAPSAAAEERGVRHEIVLGVAVLALVAGTVSAQDRKAQAVTGVGLASLGVYAALADRDCVYPWESMLDGLCGWRTTDEHTVGVDPDLPREQLVSGLAVAGIGGLMAGGAWRPSKSVDAAFTAGAGFLLLAVARDDGYPRGTVVVQGEEGEHHRDLPRRRRARHLRVPRHGRGLLPHLLQPTPHDVGPGSPPSGWPPAGSCGASRR